MPWKSFLIPRYKNLDDLEEKEDKQDLAWPIPIWRPRAHPAVPFRKRLFNLLSPKPRLDDIERGDWLLLRTNGPRGRGKAVFEGSGTGRRGRDVDLRMDEGELGTGYGAGARRRAVSDYTRAGGAWEGDVIWDMDVDIDRTCRGSSNSVVRVSTPRITITPIYDPPPSPRTKTLDLPRPILRPRPIPIPSSFPPMQNDISTTSLSSTLQVQLFPPLPANTTAFPFPHFPGTSSAHSIRSAPPKSPVPTRGLALADSTRTRFPSCSSHTPSQSPTLHAPFEPLGPSYTLTYPPSLARGASPSHLHPASPGTRASAKMQRSSTQSDRLLYLYDLRRSLDVARELLYARNRLAMRMLCSARTSSGDDLPGWVSDQWTRELDDWWARTSGLLNLAYTQINIQIQEAEKELRMEEGLAGGTGVYGWRRGKKKSGRFWTALRRVKRDKGRSEADLGSGGRAVRRVGEKCDKDHLDLNHLRAPSWVVDLVPEAFGPDEIEREIWRLEGLEVVSSGTYCRMELKGLIEAGQNARVGTGDGGRQGNGLGGMGGFKLTRTEEVLAADLGLRGVDVDGAEKGERDGWRRAGGTRGLGRRRVGILG